MVIVDKVPVFHFQSSSTCTHSSRGEHDRILQRKQRVAKAFQVLHRIKDLLDDHVNIMDLKRGAKFLELNNQYYMLFPNRDGSRLPFIDNLQVIREKYIFLKNLLKRF